MNYCPSTTQQNKPTNQRKGALHLTQQVDYALNLLTFLASHQSSSINHIAQETQISALYLQKIAGNLKKAKLITSTRGKHGGYTLAQKPEQISIQQVIEALEGKIAIAHCLKDQCQLTANCKIKKGISQINQELLEYLSTKRLTHFL